MDSRRYLSTFAVFSLVLLRLVIGWHFFGEGGKKLQYDRHDSELRMKFSAEGFLAGAKGPLAKLYHSQSPDDHGFRELLAVPWQNVADTGKPVAQPRAPYQDWADRIAADWQAMRDEVKAVAGLSDEQRAEADEAYTQRIQQVENYLAAEKDAIIEYQHELWRLENWRTAPEAGHLPFHDERIATKAAETNSQPAAWRNQIRELKAAYQDDLQGILTPEQQQTPTTAVAFNNALTDSRNQWLHITNLTVTWLTVGVGVCLLLGFFTRLASIVGALFLLAVIASQPPWLADAEPTMSQCIEFAGLLVLAGTGAGRWVGLDYFTWAVFRRRSAET